MKILYCGNILPSQLISELKLSVAGNKYEVSLIKSLNKIWGHNLDIVSIANIGKDQKKIQEFKYLFDDKEFEHISTTNLPIIRDFAKFFSLLFFLIVWALKNNKTQKKIIVLNSSFSVSVVSIFMKVIFSSGIYSLTIDTPYPNLQSKFFLYKVYQKLKYKIGHYLLRFFDGVMVLNKSVIKNLKLKIPYLVTKIGYDETLYTKDFNINKVNNGRKKIIYAGTLIEYNGIIELLEGFILLDENRFELHIYGSGNLKKVVLNFSEKYSNIFYHGLIDNKTLLNKLAKGDLLINPRITSSGVNDFGFPSKLIEYILSGVPVLTTEFGSIPDEYKNFLHIIKEESPDGIKREILNVFNKGESLLKKQCIDGVEYVQINNSWSTIIQDIVYFIEN